MSIDVVRHCPVHGQEPGEVTIGRRQFCAECLAVKLLAVGVHEVGMKTIDREKATEKPEVECECCHGMRADTPAACHICGHQPPERSNKMSWLDRPLDDK